MKTCRTLVFLTCGLLCAGATDLLAVPIVPSGFSARVVAGGLGIFPQAIELATDGTILVADYSGSVHRVAPDGAVSSLDGPFSHDYLQGLVVRESGDVFVSSERRVFRLASGAASFSIFAENPTRFNARDICGDL